MSRTILSHTILTIIFLWPLFLPSHGSGETFTASRSYPYYFYLKGLLELSSGQISEAKKSFLEASHTDPDSSDTATQLAVIAAKENNTDEALKWGRHALEIDPDNDEARMLLAKIYEYNNDYTGATTLLREIVDKHPDNREALSMLASIYSRTGEDDKAIDTFEKLARADGPRAFVASYYLGRLYLKKGKTEKAEAAFSHALENRPEFIPAKLELARCYKRSGKVKEAMELYRAILRERNTPAIRSELADLLITEKRSAEAEKELRAMMLDGGENSIRAGLQMAVDYIKTDKPGNALLVLNIILETRPDNDQATFLAALAREQNNDPETAEKLLEKIDRKGPFGIEATVRRAWLLEKKGEPDKAASILRDALKEQPAEKELSLALASILEKREAADEALNLLGKALEANPSDVEIMMHMAMLLDSGGNKKKAVETAEKILEIDPDYVPALNFAGYLYAEQGRKLERAEKLITRALSFKPDDGYIVDSMGWVCFMKKDYGLAVKYLEKAHNLVPKDPIIISHLGEALVRLGKYERALNVLKKGRELAGEGSEIRKKIEEQIKTAQKKLWDMVDN
jgi:tetratricopeptide (TPR) repeat protein